MTPKISIEQHRTLLSIREAGHQLGLSRSTVYALLAERRLVAVKLGKRTLIPRESISAFIVTLPHARFANSAAKAAVGEA